MATGGENWRRRFNRWLDQWKVAGSGIILATRRRSFLIAFLISFVIFGTLMSLLSGSTAAFNLFWQVDLPGKMQIISDAVLAFVGVGRKCWDWLLTFAVVVLQSILIGLVVLVWRKRRRSHKEQIIATAANSENIQNAGLAAGLAVLGSGCPTCGTTLLAPMLSTLFSTSGFAMASLVSGLLTVASVLVALLALKRVGGDAYAMIVSERYQKSHSGKEKKS